MSARVTAPGDALRPAQRLHAFAITVLPFAGTLAALLWFRASAVDWVLLLGFYLGTILGITVGFHRHFAHSGFKAGPGLRWLLGVLGSMAAQGPLVYWVANHRRHHSHSDTGDDPHSPYHDGARTLGGWRGFWHAHVGWMFTHQTTSTQRFARDLLRDPLVRHVNVNYLAWVALGLALPAAIGGLAAQSWSGALSGFLWGGVVRLFLTFHATNAVNSVTHMFGARPFASGGRSTNNAWLALPVLGEGWHNNHHAFPQSAIFGLEWWQIDIGGLVVLALKRLGLVWDVNRPSREVIELKKAAPGRRMAGTG